jgi:hypothetical protein
MTETRRPSAARQLRPKTRLLHHPDRGGRALPSLSVELEITGSSGSVGLDNSSVWVLE